MNIKLSQTKEKQIVVEVEFMSGETTDDFRHMPLPFDTPLTEMKIIDILDALSNGDYTAKVTVSARRIISKPFKPQSK